MRKIVVVVALLLTSCAGSALTPTPTPTPMPAQGFEERLLKTSYTDFQAYLAEQGHGVIEGVGFWVAPGDGITRDWTIPEYHITGQTRVEITPDLEVNDLFMYTVSIEGQWWGVPLMYVQAVGPEGFLVVLVTVDAPSPTIPLDS